MKASLLAVAVVLALAGCSSARPDPTEAVPASDGAAPAAKPYPLEYDVVAVMPIESGDHARLAMCRGRFAYVAGQSQIIVGDWRSLTSRVVFSTDHSFLSAVRQTGCRFEVFDDVSGTNGEDTSEPGRTLVLDLRTLLVRSHPGGSGHEVHVATHVAHGSSFTARVRRGHVYAEPLHGGQEVRLPGRVGPLGTWPVARGGILAYTVRHHGWTRLQVLRIRQP